MTDRRLGDILKKKVKGLALGFMDPKARFQRIYKQNLWGSEESVSGHGSTLKNTQSIRSEFPTLLKDLGINRLLDAPCGDFHWFAKLIADNDLVVAYHGIDIVPELIAANAAKYTNTNTQFSVGDITASDLPKVDMVLCRHCFIHLSSKDIKKAIGNFKRTGATYLATSTYEGIDQYEEIATGQFRNLDLRKAPFDFPVPVRTIPEDDGQQQLLGIWKLDELPF